MVAMSTWGDISSVRRLTEAVIFKTTIQYDMKEEFRGLSQKLNDLLNLAHV